MFVLDRLKEMNSVIISSSFLVMEAADFKKDSLYFVKKVVEEKWEMRRAIRESYRKDLRIGDFYNISDWITELRDKLQIQLYDFLVDSDTWELAQYISQNSNLFAPDVIHLASAIVASKAGVEIDGGEKIECNTFISNDDLLRTEGENIKRKQEISYPDILTISQTREKFLGTRC